MSPIPTPSISLRERNFAQVRLSIMEAAIALSTNRAYNDLSVREISERAGISQGTFFNHFPSKSDVLFFFMKIWTLRAFLRTSRVLENEGTARMAINSIFSFVTLEMERYPRMMLEVISEIAHANQPPQVSLSLAERAILFPDQPDIASMKVPTMEGLFANPLHHAIKSGELPRSTSIKTVAMMLRAMFYGVPIATRGQSIAAIARAYEEGLELLWKGLASKQA